MVTKADKYRLGYRGDIEGLRAIAILLVIGAHARVPWLVGGFVGVDVFFVLSGFLITGLLVQEVTDTGQLRFVDFYIRRLRRLLPALILMLVVAGLLASVLLAPFEQLPQATAGASAAAWFSNIHFTLARLDYFSPGTETNIFLHTWSLGVEEQFYLVWPALVYVMLRNSSHRIGIARLRACMLLVMVTSFIACVVATYKVPQFAFYMMPMRAWQFAVGALVWLHLNTPETETHADGSSKTSRATLVMIGWLGLVAMLGAAVWLGTNVPYPGLCALVPTLGAACVIASGSRSATTGVPRLLSYWPMQAVGRISYAWYLWHWPVLLLGHALTGSDAPGYRALYVAISLMLAVGSHYAVEAPIRHQRWWLTHQRASIYGAIVVMIGCSMGFLRWNGHAYWDAHSPTQIRYLSAHNDGPIIYGMHCIEWYHSERLTPCIVGSEEPKHTAVIVGDSIAAQWFPAVVPFFVGPDWRLIVYSKAACPMVDEPYFYSLIGREYTECAIWRAAALKEIASMRPDVVLTSSVVAYEFTPQQWTEGSARVMQQLSAAAGQVYVLRSTPHLPFDGPNCLAEHASRPAWLEFGSGCSAKSTDDRSNLVYASVQRAAEPFRNVHMVDMTDLICPGGLCTAERNGMIIFRDAGHMTASFAASLAPELAGRFHLNNVAADGSGNGESEPNEKKTPTNFR
jgi:peptidoglycan/LPS O-acetylase OafA/YrhL